MSSPLPDLLLNDRGFVFDAVSGETFQLSTTGLRIVRLFQQNVDEEDVLARILEEFEVDENTARRDLDGFRTTLAQLGWL